MMNGYDHLYDGDDIRLEDILLQYDDDSAKSVIDDIYKKKPKTRFLYNDSTLQKVYGDKWQDIKGSLNENWVPANQQHIPIVVEDLISQYGEDTTKTVLDRAHRIGMPISIMANTLRDKYGDKASEYTKTLRENGWMVFGEPEWGGDPKLYQKAKEAQTMAQYAAKEAFARDPNLKNLYPDEFKPKPIPTMSLEEQEAEKRRRIFPTEVALNDNFLSRTFNRFRRAVYTVPEIVSDTMADFGAEFIENTGAINNMAMNVLNDASGGGFARIFDLKQTDDGYVQVYTTSDSYSEDFRRTANAANKSMAIVGAVPITYFALAGAGTRTLADVAGMITGKAKEDWGGGGLAAQTGPYHFDWADPVNSSFDVISQAAEKNWVSAGGDPRTAKEIGPLAMLLVMAGANRAANPLRKATIDNYVKGTPLSKIQSVFAKSDYPTMKAIKKITEARQAVLAGDIAKEEAVQAEMAARQQAETEAKATEDALMSLIRIGEEKAAQETGLKVETPVKVENPKTMEERLVDELNQPIEDALRQELSGANRRGVVRDNLAEIFYQRERAKAAGEKINNMNPLVLDEIKKTVSESEYRQIVKEAREAADAKLKAEQDMRAKESGQTKKQQQLAEADAMAKRIGEQLREADETNRLQSVELDMLSEVNKAESAIVTPKELRDFTKEKEAARQQAEVQQYAEAMEVERKNIEQQKLMERYAELKEAQRQGNEMIRYTAEQEMKRIEQEVGRAEGIRTETQGAGPQEGLEGQAGGRASLRDVAKDRVEAQAGEKTSLGRPAPAIEFSIEGNTFSRLTPEERAELSSRTDQEIVDAAKRNDVRAVLEDVRRNMVRLENKARIEMDEIIRRSATTAFSGIDPTFYWSAAKLGAAKIVKGAIDFTVWSADMVREYGDRVKPHLEKLWEDSKRIADFAQKLNKINGADVFTEIDNRAEAQLVRATMSPQELAKMEGKLSRGPRTSPAMTPHNVVMDYDPNSLRNRFYRLAGGGTLLPGEKVSGRILTRMRSPVDNPYAVAFKIANALSESTSDIRFQVPSSRHFETILKSLLAVNSKFSKIIEDGMIRGYRSGSYDRSTEGGFWRIFEPLPGKPNSELHSKYYAGAMDYMVAERTLEEYTNNWNKFQERMAEIKNRPSSGLSAKEATKIHLKDVAAAMKEWKEFTDKNESNRLTGFGASEKVSDTEAASRYLQDVATRPADHSIYGEVARRFREWSTAVMQYPVDMGRISQDTFDRVVGSHEKYVPLNRFFDEFEQDMAGNVYYTTSNMQSRLGKDLTHAFKGSGRPIENPFATMLMKTYQIVRDSDRNNALVTLVELVEEAHRNHPEHFGKFFAEPVKSDAKGAVKVYRNGEAEYWRFDPEVVSAFDKINKDTPFWLSKIGEYTQVYKTLVTHSPKFMLRNPVRDSIERAALSEHGAYPWHMIKPMDDVALRQFFLTGGGHTGWYAKDASSYYTLLKRIINDSQKGKSGRKEYIVDPQTAVDMLHGIWDKWGKMAEWTEIKGRMSEYEKAYEYAQKKLGFDEVDASYYASEKAADLPNFLLKGTFIGAMDKIFPFIGPRVTGARRYMKSVKRDIQLIKQGGSADVVKRRGAGLAGKAIGMATVGNFGAFQIAARIMEQVWNHSEDADEEWRELDPYLRDMFVNLKGPKSLTGEDFWIRIPIGFETSVVSSGIGRAFDYMRGNENAFGRQGDYWQNLFQAFSPLDQGSVAGIFKPVIEYIANYDFFRRRHVINPRQEDWNIGKLKEEGVFQKASKPAQLASNVTHAIIDQTLDPRKLDHFMSGLVPFWYDAFNNTYATFEGEQEGMTPARLGSQWIGLTGTGSTWSSDSVAYVMQKAKEFGESDKTHMKDFRKLAWRASNDPDANKRHELKLKLYEQAKKYADYYATQEKNLR